MDIPQPLPQHKILTRLVGEWTFESGCDMGPDKPRETFRGRETVQAIGPFWIVCTGKGESPMGTSHLVLTLGYDPQKQRYVGSFIASMMTHQWLYEGTADASGHIITLNSEGPSFENPAIIKPYRDTIEIHSDDHRSLASSFPDADGNWKEFMRAEYRRVK